MASGGAAHCRAVEAVPFDDHQRHLRVASRLSGGGGPQRRPEMGTWRSAPAAGDRAGRSTLASGDGDGAESVWCCQRRGRGIARQLTEMEGVGSSNVG